MAGYSKLYVVGGLGGHMGADGVNPIEFLVLVGDAGRQWLEPHYFDRYDRAPRKSSNHRAGRTRPFGQPAGCVHRLLPSKLQGLPLHRGGRSGGSGRGSPRLRRRSEGIPSGWARLREEARPVFRARNIWRADLVPVASR